MFDNGGDTQKSILYGVHLRFDLYWKSFVRVEYGAGHRQLLLATAT